MLAAGAEADVQSCQSSADPNGASRAQNGSARRRLLQMVAGSRGPNKKPPFWPANEWSPGAPHFDVRAGGRLSKGGLERAPRFNSKVAPRGAKICPVLGAIFRPGLGRLFETWLPSRTLAGWLGERGARRQGTSNVHAPVLRSASPSPRPCARGQGENFLDLASIRHGHRTCRSPAIVAQPRRNERAARLDRRRGHRCWGRRGRSW